MAIARNVRWNNVQLTGSAGATTAAATPAAGDGIVLFAVINDGITPTFTNTAGYTTKPVGNWGPSTGARANRLWMNYVEGTQVTAVSSTWHIDTGGVGSLITFGATSYTGLAATNALDKVAFALGNSTALLSAVTPVTSFANELVVGCGFVDTAVGGTWTAGSVGGAYLNDGAAGTTAVGAGCAMGVESRVDAAANTKQADFTWTGSASPWVMVVATFADTPVPPPNAGPDAGDTNIWQGFNRSPQIAGPYSPGQFLNNPFNRFGPPVQPPPQGSSQGTYRRRFHRYN